MFSSFLLSLPIVLLLPGAVAPGTISETRRAPALDWEDRDGAASSVLIHVTGLPRGEFRRTLDPDQMLVKLVARTKNGPARETVMSVAAMINPLVLKVPAGVPCGLSLEIGSMYGIKLPSLAQVTLEEGQKYAVELDLQLEDMVRTRLLDVPCGLAEGLVHTAPGRGVELRLPGQVTRQFPLPFKWSFDAQGRGYFPRGGDGKSLGYTTRGGWHRCFELALLDRQDLRNPEGADVPEEWLIAPRGTVACLQAKRGLGLEIAAGRVAKPRYGFAKPSDPHWHTQFLTDTSPEFMTVFVDQKKLGSFRVADVLAGGETCVDVADIPFLKPAPTLRVLINGVGTGRTPEAPFRHADDWAMYLTRVDDELTVQQGAAFFDSTAAIVPNGEVAGNVPTLATWDPARSDTLTATATLFPGDYWVSMRDRTYDIQFVDFEPLHINEDRMTILRIDLDQVQRHVLVPRNPGQSRAPGFLSSDIDLLVGATKIFIGRHDDRTRGAGPRPDEDYAELLTLSPIPAEALLYGAPGGNGMKVRLRPARAKDRAPGATLVAEIPRAQRVLKTFPAVAGGHIFGFSDGSRRGAEPPLYGHLTDGQEGPRSVQSYGKNQLGMIFRGTSATGVAMETRRGGRALVRDWLYASPEGLQFAGGGKGLWGSVVNRRDEPITLAWIPGDPESRGFLPELACRLRPGQELKLWIPKAAQALRWYSSAAFPDNRYDERWTPRDVPSLGEITDLDAPSFELR